MTSRTSASLEHFWTSFVAYRERAFGHSFFFWVFFLLDLLGVPPDSLIVRTDVFFLSVVSAS